MPRSPRKPQRRNGGRKAGEICRGPEGEDGRNTIEKEDEKKLVITGVVVVGAVMAAAAGTLLYLNLREKTEQPELLFTAYFRALSQQDYEAMYGQLSAESREAVRESGAVCGAESEDLRGNRSGKSGDFFGRAPGRGRWAGDNSLYHFHGHGGGAADAFQ